MPPMLRTAVSTPTSVAVLYERRTNNATQTAATVPTIRLIRLIRG